MDDQDPTVFVMVLLDRNSLPKSLEKAMLSPARLLKRQRSNDFPRTLVSNAQDHLPPTFIRKGNTIFDQAVELVGLFRGLEFQAGAFRRIKPGSELLRSGRHVAPIGSASALSMLSGLGELAPISRASRRRE